MKDILHAGDISPFYHVVGEYNVRLNDMEMSQSGIAPAILGTIIMREVPKRVIEIGTCKGGMSALLSYVCQSNGAEFITMDVREPLQYNLAPCGRYLNWNCFEHVEEIGAWISSEGLTILLCDGGNKVREFNAFSKVLKTGDIIGAHDYMAEGDFQSNIGWGFCEVQLQDLDLNGLEPFHHYWTELSGWTIWRKT